MIKTATNNLITNSRFYKKWGWVLNVVVKFYSPQAYWALKFKQHWHV